jgi:SAM-dependent methyltransferase
VAQYDSVAVEYERHIAPQYAAIAGLVADRAGVTAGLDVVELAVGTGVLTRLLAPATLPSGRYVGVDISPGMLAVAREVVDRRVELLVGDVTDIPLPDRCADLVVCSLGPVRDVALGLDEACRLLRPGGRIALAVWGDGYRELDVLDRARVRLGLDPYPPAAGPASARRASELGLVSVRLERHRLPVVHEDLDSYVAYRGAFGRPPGVDPRLQAELLAAIADEAARWVRADGRVHLDWTIDVLVGAAGQAEAMSGDARQVVVR